MAERLSTVKTRAPGRLRPPSREQFRNRHRISVEFGTRRSQPTRANSGSVRRNLEFHWADAIPDTEWKTYRKAIGAVRNANIPVLLGGGFALATFTGRWRDTKDIDFYVMPRARAAAIAALKKAGFSDYYKTKPYDRRWIYRSVRSGVIVDIIWSMANRRARVDNLWFENARSVLIRGEPLKVVPVEEFMWCKLYILQRDHCDWTDVFNVIFSSGTAVNWIHLIKRLGPDVSLLKGLLSVYSWLCPGNAAKLPERLWKMLNLSKANADARPIIRKHVRYLDSRAWFAALQRTGTKVQV